MLPGNLVGKAFCKVGLVLIYPSRHEYTQRAQGTLSSENKQSWNKYCMDGFLARLATEGRNQVQGYLFSILFTHQGSLCWLGIIKIDSPKTLRASIKLSSFYWNIYWSSSWLLGKCVQKVFFSENPEFLLIGSGCGQVEPSLNFSCYQYLDPCKYRMSGNSIGW